MARVKLGSKGRGMGGDLQQEELEGRSYLNSGSSTAGGRFERRLPDVAV